MEWRKLECPVSTPLSHLQAPRTEGRTGTNYIAIFVGAIAAFIIASVYYGVVFLDQWLQVRRLNPTSIGEVSTSPTQPVIEFLTTLVIAFAIGHLVARLGITHVRGALRLAALESGGGHITPTNGINRCFATRFSR